MALTLPQLVLIMLTVTALSLGQILFKLAASRLDFSTEGLWSNLYNPVLVSALVVYLLATLMWLLVLRQIPLRIAYPFAGLAFIIVPLLANLFLKEPLHWQSIVGALLIGLGVYVSTLS